MNALARDLPLRRSPRRRLARGYDEPGEVNLAGYSGSLLAFVASALGVGIAARRTSSGTASVPMRDIAVGGMATHTLSRLLAKGAVTSPIRAPFTEFQEPAGASQHRERPRGHGVRHTLGELMTCPFCLSQWTAGAYVAGLALAPSATRRWAAMFAVAGISDAMHHAYDRLRTG